LDTALTANRLNDTDKINVYSKLVQLDKARKLSTGIQTNVNLHLLRLTTLCQQTKCVYSKAPKGEVGGLKGKGVERELWGDEK